MEKCLGGPGLPPAAGFGVMSKHKHWGEGETLIGVERVLRVLGDEGDLVTGGTRLGQRLVSSLLTGVAETPNCYLHRTLWPRDGCLSPIGAELNGDRPNTGSCLPCPANLVGECNASAEGYCGRVEGS